jgi:hypothetical protein
LKIYEGRGTGAGMQRDECHIGLCASLKLKASRETRLRDIRTKIC